MELDPKYCDVILQRWADFTGKDPVRQDGAKWSRLKQEHPGNDQATNYEEEKRAA